MSKQRSKRMCKICRQRRELKFATGSIAICRHCVNLLNRVPISPQQAILNLQTRCVTELQAQLRQQIAGAVNDEKEQLKQQLATINSEASNAFPSWLKAKLLDKKDRSRELRVVRAYRRGILTYKPSFLSMPENWDSLTNEIKERDNWMCTLCGQQEARRFMHVHHIVQPRNSGTNKPANLVTLCFRCFKSQHSNATLEDHEIFAPEDFSDSDTPEATPQPLQVTTPKPIASKKLSGHYRHTERSYKPLLMTVAAIIASILILLLVDYLAG